MNKKLLEHKIRNKWNINIIRKWTEWPNVEWANITGENKEDIENKEHVFCYRYSWGKKECEHLLNFIW